MLCAGTKTPRAHGLRIGVLIEVRGEPERTKLQEGSPVLEVQGRRLNRSLVDMLHRAGVTGERMNIVSAILSTQSAAK